MRSNMNVIERRLGYSDVVPFIAALLSAKERPVHVPRAVLDLVCAVWL